MSLLKFANLVAIFAALAISLAGCGGGGSAGGDQATNTANNNYFPAAVGDRWYYKRSDGAVISTHVTATMVVDASQGLRIVSNAIAPYSERTETVYVIAADRVRMYSLGESSNSVDIPSGVDVLQLPLVAGRSFNQPDTVIQSDVDFDGIRETVSLKTSVTVVGFEFLRTGTSEFSNVAHVRTTVVGTGVSSSTRSAFRIEVTGDDWYAPGIGLVKSSISQNSNGQRTTTSREIISYAVGDEKSERVAPTLIGSTPASGTLSGGPITLQFDEAIDETSLSAGIVFRDDAGQTIESSPANILGIAGGHITYGIDASRSTTLRVHISITNRVTDRAGNPLTNPSEWTVTLDTRGPVLVSSNPLHQQLDFLPSSPIVLRFDEPIGLEHIRSGAHFRLSIGLYDSIPLSFAIVGDTITLQPEQPLMPGLSYLLRISNIPDRFGWGSEAYALSFSIDQERFLPARPLYAYQTDYFYGQAQLLGEVSNGRSTFLLTEARLTPNQGYEYSIVRKIYTTDGGMAEPITVASGFGACEGLKNLRVVDFNGDGRPDFVVSGYRCGIKVFLQNPDGTFSLDQTMPSAFSNQFSNSFHLVSNSSQTQVAWIATRDDQMNLALYERRAQGWAIRASFPVNFSYVDDAKMADLDGDGLADLSIHHLGEIQIWRQNSNGTFRDPIKFDFSPERINNVATGMVGGDGRDSLVIYSQNGLYDPYNIRIIRLAGDQVVVRQAITHSVGNRGFGSLFVDINGDGLVDYLAVEGGGFSVRLQGSDGRLGSAVPFLIPGLSDTDVSIQALDINGDGRLDILLGNMIVVQKSPSSPPARARNRIGSNRD
jgi:hypothetical protein